MQQLDHGTRMTVCGEQHNDAGELWYSVVWHSQSYYVLAELVEATNASEARTDGETIPDFETSDTQEEGPSFVPVTLEGVLPASLVDYGNGIYAYTDPADPETQPVLLTYGSLNGGELAFYVVDEYNVADFTAPFEFSPSQPVDAGFIELVPEEVPWFYTVLQTDGQLSENEAESIASLLWFFVASANAEATTPRVYQVDIDGVLNYRVYGICNGVIGFYACNEDGSNINTTAVINDTAPAFVPRTPVADTVPVYYEAVIKDPPVTGLYKLTAYNGSPVYYRLYVQTDKTTFGYYPCDENGRDVNLSVVANTDQDAAVKKRLSTEAQTFVDMVKDIDTTATLEAARAVVEASDAATASGIVNGGVPDQDKVEAMNAADAIYAPFNTAIADALDSYADVPDDELNDLRVLAALDKLTALKSAIDALSNTQPMLLAYNPGTLVLTGPAAGSPDATSYKLSDPFLTQMINIQYTSPVGQPTNHVVLVVDIPAYGIEWASTLDSTTNVNIADALRLSDTCYIIRLADGKYGDVNIDFTVKFKALTQAQCEAWMDDGSLPVTNYRLREIAWDGTTALADILNNPTTNPVQANSKQFFTTDITLANTTAETATAPHTYEVSVSSVGWVTDWMTGMDGYGGASGNNLYCYGPVKDPNLLYAVPTIHTDDTPLMEFNSIKLYVPDEKMELLGVTNTPSSQTNVVKDSNYYQIWKDWSVSARQTDVGGSYYVLTPPTGTRLFNNGTSDKQGTLNYGMRLLWKLADPDTATGELSYAATAYTDHQNVNNSSLGYTIPSGSPTATIKSFDHESANVITWARDTQPATAAYNPVRAFDNVPNNNITLGSFQRDQILTYLNNTWYKSTVAGVITEHLPAGNGACVQTYPFPFVIQPQDMTFTDAAQGASDQYNRDVDTRGTVMGGLTYTLHDGTTHSATAAEVAAINAYYDGTSTTPGKVTFVGISDTNPVTSVVVTWASVVTGATNAWYPRGSGQIILNGAGTGTRRTVSGIQSTVITKCSYKVATKDENGNPYQEYSLWQSPYTVAFTDPAYTNLAADPTYLWWRLRTPACPTFFTGQSSTNSYNISCYADGASVYDIGYLRVDIGKYGERIDIMSNPSIDFRMVYDNTRLRGSDTTVNNLTGITEAEGVAFLTGEFTAMPKLSGWTFDYSTTQRTGLHYTVPTITDVAGQVVQIPLNDGEYFTSLTMRYAGDFDTAHESEASTRTYWDLMTHIKLRALHTNPNDDVPIHTTDPYSYTAIQLRGTAHWDSCMEDNTPHRTGHEVAYANYGKPNSSYRQPPQWCLYFTRQAQLAQAAAPVMPATVPDVYQGQGTTGVYRFNIFGNTSGGSQLYPFKWPTSTIHNALMPWEDVSEAVYLELQDPEFIPNLADCKLYNVPVSSGNVLASTVSVGGKTYLKLKFRDGYTRTQSLRDNPYNGTYMNNFLKNAVTDEPNWYLNSSNSLNAAGIVEVPFTTLPGTTIGLHYPIGDVYLDFTDLLENYDAPNTITGYDEDRTNWLIAGNADNASLSGSTATDTNQLFKYSFAKDSTEEYAVNVIKAMIVGANYVPGKLSTQYDFSEAKNMDFFPSERSDLNALVSLVGSESIDVFDMNVYVNVPKAGKPITYMDSQGNTHTITGVMDFFLRGVPVVIGDSTDLINNLHFAYTTDSNPTEASQYNTTVPTTTGQWAQVTGIRIQADKIPKLTAINLRLDYETPAKTSIDDLHAYSAGTFKFKGNDVTTQYETGDLPLIRWTHNDFVVSNPYGGVFWDVYNEDGVRQTNASYGESWVPGITVELLEPDSDTVIDTQVTDANGRFTLRSYKNDAGQRLRITMPTDLDYTVKLTKQSEATMTASPSDSDIDRETNTLTLPLIPDNGFENLSAGLVKLPQISIPDKTFVLGAAPTPYRATLTDYLGMNHWTASVSPAYRLNYTTPVDAAIVNFNPVTATAATTTVTPTINAVGKTTATVWVTNRLGDRVEVTYNITVTTSFSNIPISKVWVDNNNALGARPASVTWQLQRKLDLIGTLENVGSAVTVLGSGTNAWRYIFTNQPDYDNDTGVAYIYSVKELNVNPNYEASYQTDAVTSRPTTVTNTLKLIDVNGVKTWEEHGTGFSRPTEIELTLMRDGVAMTPDTTYKKTITEATADAHTANTWDYHFSDVLQYNPITGAEYVYTVSETPLDPTSNYNAEENGMDVTNVFPARRTYTVNKVWDYTDAPANGRPMQATVRLYRDGMAFAGTQSGDNGVATIVGNGSHDFIVAETEAAGHTFFVREDTIPGYQATIGTFVVNPANSYEAVATITNKYTPIATTYNPAVTKAINGTPGYAKDFIFTLTSLNTNHPMPNDATTISVSKNVNGEGSVSFGDITFIRAGTYTYSIQETDQSANPNYKGYTFDSTVYTLTVEVVDTTGNGQLSATATMTKPDGAGGTTPVTLPLTITNEYVPLSTTYITGVNKAIIGDPVVVSANFDFTLAAAAVNPTAPLPAGRGNTVQIAGTGYGEFGTIPFTQAGTYTYTISETIPADSDKAEGYTYSTTPVTVVITVTDVDGQLTATADVQNDAIIITNTFTTPMVTISGTKSWVGNFGTTHKDATINLWQNNADPGNTDMPLQTFAITDGGTSYTFSAPKYDATGKLHTYTVTETPINGVVIDQDGRNFTNIKVTPGTAEILALNKLDGSPSPDGMFTCDLTQVGYVDSTGTQQPFLAYTDTKPSIGGDLDFDTLSYTTSGTFVYTLRQQAGTDPLIVYDPSVYTVTVVNHYDAATATVIVDSVSYQKGTEPPTTTPPTFYNTRVRGELRLRKVRAGAAATAGDSFTFNLRVKRPTDATMSAYIGTYSVFLTADDSPVAGKQDLPTTGSLTLVGGEYAKITDLAVGTEYAFTETQLPSYLAPVTTNPTGTIVAAGNLASFTNIERTGDLVISKSQNGGPMGENFRFLLLVSPDGNPTGTQIPYVGAYTVTGTGAPAGTQNTADGYVTLQGGWSATISGLENGKTYRFTAQEVPTSTYTVQSVNTMGTINVGSPNAPQVSFINTFVPPTPAVYPPAVAKNVNGAAAATNDYRFTITQTGQKDKTGADVTFTPYTEANVANAAGVVNFTPLSLTAEGTYTYSIVEEMGTTPMVYDAATTYVLTLTVTRDATNNTLNTVAAYTKNAAPVGGTPTFNNYTYKAITPALANPTVQKIITGDTRLVESTFTMVLTAGDVTTPMPDNRAGGTKEISITGIASDNFGPITYTLPGIYTYTIDETAGTIPGYTYDTSSYIMEIEVTADAQGNLTATRTLQKAGADVDIVSFSNPYVRPKVTVKGVKQWNGVPTGVTVPTVQVNLWQNNANPQPGDRPLATTTITAGDATYSFTDLDRYDATLTPYVYTITETVVPGYDTLIGVPVIDTTTGDTTINLTNTYHPTPALFDPPVRKIVTGINPPTTPFTFVMTADDPTSPMPSGSVNGVKTVTTNCGASTEIEFGDMTYTAVGTHTYRLSETNTAAAHYTYDTTVYTMTVTVIDVNGALQATATYGAGTAPMTFTNVYTRPSGKLTVSKTVTGDASNKSETFPFIFSFSENGDYTYTGSFSGTVRNNSTIFMKHGQSITVEGIPAGTVYTVTETDSKNYRASATGATGTITANGTVTASFTNNKSSVPKTGADGWYEMAKLLMIIFGTGLAIVIILRVHNRKRYTRR